MFKRIWMKIPRSVRFAAITAAGIGYAGVLTSLVDRSAHELHVRAAEEEIEPAEITETVAIEDLPEAAEAPDVIDREYPRYWLNSDTDLLESSEILSSAGGRLQKRDMVYVMETSSPYVLVLCGDGTTGYIRESVLETGPEKIFDPADEVKWLSEDTVLKTEPSENGGDIYGAYNTEIVITGTNEYHYWQALYNDEVVYVENDKLMDEMYVEPEPEPEPVRVYDAPMSNPSWDGTVLNAWMGTIMGPSGKETYYNLPMGGVINIMQNAGYDYEYWVRSDGVKMYGDYVMAACSLDIRPRGSTVETSLGTAICADTGTFAYTNPTQVDIAVDW